MRGRGARNGIKRIPFTGTRSVLRATGKFWDKNCEIVEGEPMGIKSGSPFCQEESLQKLINVHDRKQQNYI